MPHRIAVALFALAAAAPASAQALGEARRFNLWTFGDAFLQGADAQGPVAIGGNGSINAFGIATSAVPPFPAVGLAVGGNLAFANGAVQHGDAYVAGAASGGFGLGTGTLHQNVGAAGLPVAFAATNAELRNRSAFWATLPANGSVANVAGTLTLVGSDPALDVFSVSANQLPGITGLSITVPNGATALVNVAGANATFTNFGTLLNNLPRNRLLFNLPGATGLAISNVSFQGSILAPNAALAFQSGNIEGNVVVGSAGTLQIPATGEYHFDPTNFPFVGILPVPEPASLLLAAAGLAALAARRRRWRRGDFAVSGSAAYTVQVSSQS